MYGLGGGRWSQFCTKSCKRKDTQGTGNALRITHYSESDSLSSLRLSTRAGTFWRPACFTFCSKSTSMQVARNSCREALVGCVFLSQNCAAKAAASEADRIWCSSWSYAGCCEPPVRGFFAVLGVLMRLTLHPGSSPRACSFASQRLLPCIWGCNSMWREFVPGHGGCLLTKTASKQHRHCPKKTKISNILSVQHADSGCSK